MATEKFPPPEGLDDQSRRLWRKTRDFLMDRPDPEWEDSDVVALERYIRSVQRAREARDGTDKLTTHGSQGQLVEHPLVKVARDADRDAQSYAGDLLITPAARKRYELEAEKEGGKFGAALG